MADFSEASEVCELLIQREMERSKNLAEEVRRLQEENTKLWSAVTHSSMIAGSIYGYFAAPIATEIEPEEVARKKMSEQLKTWTDRMTEIMDVRPLTKSTK